MKNVRVFSIMRKHGLDAIIVCRQDTVAYCAGYDTPQQYGSMENFINGPFSYVLLDARQDKITLCVPDWHLGNTKTAFADEVLTFETFDFFGNVDSFASQAACMKKAVGQLKGVKKIGIEFHALPAFVYDYVKELGADIVSALPCLDESRMIKQDYEIERLRYICGLETLGMDRLTEISKTFTAGREFDVFSDVYNTMCAKHGSLLNETGDFSTGPRINKLSGVHAPDNREINVGDLGILDMSTRINGYFCDCANTVVFGREPNKEQMDLFKIVKGAFEAAREKLYPGNTLHDVDTASSEVFRKNGKEPVVYTGHQLGTNVNEVPRIQCFDTDVVQAGMVVCIEPQNYTFDAGTSGVRLEHAFLVTEHGPEDLTPFKWGLEAW